MAELILSEAQLACLKAAVTIGSEESAALGRGIGFGSKLFSPEPFAVKCTREIAARLLSVAERFCSDVVPEIRAAIEQEKQEGQRLAFHPIAAFPGLPNALASKSSRAGAPVKGPSRLFRCSPDASRRGRRDDGSRRCAMREFHCKDVGMPDCNFVAKGKDDDEVMRKAAEHAKRDHHMQAVPPDLERKARGAIRESTEQKR